ncbi:MAG TPA: hypothetical protein VH590_01190 [Ktedonobacterales bacterium]
MPQPVAAPAAGALPGIISSRPGWFALLITPPLIWIGILVLLTLFVWGFEGSYIPTLLFSAALTVPLSILACLSSYRWIEIREDGLTIRTLFRRRTISWQDARLFAIDATVETNKTPDRYELSSATTILRWSREQEPSRWTKPSSPFPEYTQQMDALLALIAGRTGLPLYDLRDWQLPPLPAPPGPVYRSLWRGE